MTILPGQPTLPATVGLIVAATSARATAFGAQRRVRPVANRGGLGSSNVDVANANGHTQVGDQLNIQLMDDMPDLAFRLGNFRGYRTGMADLSGESAITWRGGVFTGSTYLPVFGQNGERDIVLAPGAVVDTASVGSFKKGQSILLITQKTWASPPANFPGNPVPAGSARDLSESGAALPDRTLTGGFPAAQRLSNFAILPPLAVLGTGLRRASVAVLGNSIGSQGISDATTGRGEYGFMQRGLSAAGIPSITLGQAGLRLSTVVSSAKLLGQYLQPCVGLDITHLAVELATNDWIDGRSGAAMYADYLKIRDAAAKLGMKTIPFTAPPKTNAANNAQFGTETTTWVQRRILNDLIRSANGVGDGYFDLAAVWQDAANADLWRSDLLLMTGIAIADGGSGYLQGDLIEMANGAVIQVNTVVNGAVTAAAIRASAGGGFLVPPSGRVEAQNTQSFGPIWRDQPGTGFAVTATGTGAGVSTTDGVHQTIATAAFGMQAVRDQAPTLFRM